MNRFFSSLLLCLLIFNWVGYRLLASYLEEKANEQLESAIDNEAYDLSQLVSIKIPVAYLPYYNNSASFERIDGHVEIGGVEYKYVKRRIFNDSLELLCIANPAMMKLKNVKNEYFQFVNDLQHNGSEKSSNSHHRLAKSVSPDYCAIHLLPLLTDIGIPVPNRFLLHTASVISRLHLVLEKPPEGIYFI